MITKAYYAPLACLGLVYCLNASAFASNAHDASGPYIGGGLGGLLGDSQVKRFGGLLPAGSSDRHTLSSRGLFAQLHGGWGTTFKAHSLYPLYGALELAGDFPKTQDKNRNQDDWYKLERKKSVEAALKVGLSFPSMLAYFKVGIKQTEWKFTSFFEGPAGNDPKLTQKKRTLSGAAFGVGFQTPVTPTLHIGGDYTYARYKPFKHNHGQDTAHFKITSRTHQLMLRVSYLLKP